MAKVLCISFSYVLADSVYISLLTGDVSHSQ
jgi:hypothetical protein